ncbi:MAG TPA: hypothetical protein VF260_10580 [Bacilli bacterium]
MRWLLRFFLTALFACGLAVALSLLPRQGVSGTGFSVFNHTEKIIANNGNIVDFMQQLPLLLKIRKVDLSQSVLMVDLTVEKGDSASAVFRDFYVLSVAGLRDTENIDRVLVRAVAAPSMKVGAGALLAAMDARKSRLEAEAAVFPVKDAVSAEDFVRDRFDLTFTTLWKTVFQNSANDRPA